MPIELITMIGGMPGGDSEDHWIKFIQILKYKSKGKIN